MILMICSIFLFFQFNTALAGSMSPESEMSPDPNQSSVEYIKGVNYFSGSSSVMSVDLISAWGCSIQKLNSENVYVSGHTNSYSTADTVKLTLNLQRWNGSSWVNVISRSYTDYNIKMVSGGFAYTVASYNTYRVYSTHTVEENGQVEIKSATSKGIYLP